MKERGNGKKGETGQRGWGYVKGNSRAGRTTNKKKYIYIFTDEETNTQQDQDQSDEEDDAKINNSDFKDVNVILDETDDSNDPYDMDEWS